MPRSVQLPSRNKISSEGIIKAGKLLFSGVPANYVGRGQESSSCLVRRGGRRIQIGGLVLWNNAGLKVGGVDQEHESPEVESQGEQIGANFHNESSRPQCEREASQESNGNNGCFAALL